MTDNSQTAVQTIEYVDVEIVSDAQALFLEGQSIGRKLEGGLKDTLLQFYSEAIPFAQKVKHTAPWLQKEYRHCNDPDPELAFLKFLRAAFTNDHETMAYTQAVIVRLLVNRGWSIETVEGIGLKRLWRISNIIKLVNADDQQKLLSAARDLSYRDFDATCKGIKAGYHIEPLRDKLISAPKSAMAELDNYLDARKAMGDNRMQGEILADTVGGLMIVEEDFGTFVKEIAIISLLCEIMRYFHSDMKDFPNIKILAELCTQMAKGYKDELPADLLERYESLFGKEEETGEIE